MGIFFNKQKDLDRRIAPLIKAGAIRGAQVGVIQVLDDNRPTMEAINCLIEASHALTNTLTAQEQEKGIFLTSSWRLCFKRGKVLISKNEANR